MSEGTATAPERRPGQAADVGRVIVLDVVGLRPEHLSADRTPAMTRLFGDEHPTAHLRPAFPALTVPAQTTLATGQPPRVHGDVSSGEYDRAEDAVAFWERDRAGRSRLWERASEEAGLTTGVLFFQHLIGTTADVAVTPSPIEDEDDNLLEMNCWTNPDGFYEDLREAYGHFPLHRYWGPGANEESSRWILDAARETVDRFDPDLLWVYVPHLDYDGQRAGPHGAEFDRAIETVDDLLGDFLSHLREGPRWDETAVNLVSEYGFHEVDTPVLPNSALEAAGLLHVEPVGGGDADVDLAASDAFAMVDHQVAHVYVDRDSIDAAADVLASLDGVAAVLDDDGKEAYGIDHPNAGDLVLVAEPDAWFQYYWWTDADDAPPYAADMNIHAKPGFDPCELFFGDEGLVTLDPGRVRGSHGRVDEPGYGFYGLAGPAAPEVDLEGPVAATRVAPTIAALLGVSDELATDVDPASLLDD